jgi:hypothetical protein
MEPSPLTTARHRRWRSAALIVLVIVILGTTASLVVATDTLGAGHLWERAVAKVDRLLAGPVPDRSAPATVLVPNPGSSDEPDVDPDASPSDATLSAPTTPPSGDSSAPATVPPPAATARPTPARRPVDVDIVKNDKAVFAHENKDTWCASAGVQIVLAILGHGDNSSARQRELQSRVHEWESYKDSHNGDWGPSAMSLALADYGVAGYQVRAYTTRQGALRDAAKAIETTGSPVMLMAWRGAHTWIMSGFRADADPAVFADAKITGAYILDPWYPDVSSIWGPSDPPGTFQNEAEMIRNYLKWKRPEGKYPERDGLYIAVVPTVKAR